MKAINDFRIKISDVPIYETGIQINKYDVVYYTGITPGSYSANGISQTVSAPFETGYYYALYDIPSGFNLFYSRPGYTADNIVPQWTQEWNYTPSYGSTVNYESNLYSINFGNNYQYNISKNENTLKISAQLKFDGITDLEAKSISHFYQNNALSADENSNEGLKKINMPFYPPFTKTVPCYINSINYEYKYANVNNLTVNVESPFISVADWKEKLIPYTTDQDYLSEKVYNRHDYVFIKSQSSFARGFWYCTGNNIQGELPSISENWTKKFYFVPNMSNTLNLQSKVFRNELDKFYFLQNDDANPNLMGLQLEFNNRNDKEAKAILHYLENKNGFDVFQFDGVPNFTGTRNFYCPSWSHTYNYKDNNSVSATFVETLYDPKNISVTTFNTVKSPESVNFGYVPSGFAVTKELYLTNSGDSDVYYEVQDLKERYSFSDSYISTFINDDSQVDGKILSTLNSGALKYTFYITDNPSGPKATGPVNYASINDIIQFSPENGDVGEPVVVLLTGSTDINNSFNFSTGPNNNWLKHNKYCIAYPGYDEENRKIKITTEWRPPTSGYFFDSFTAQISTASNFSPVLQTKTIDVERIDDTEIGRYLYGGYSGLADSYTAEFIGLDLETTYYIRVRGVNTLYSAQSFYTYATGLESRDFNLTNASVISGVTGSPIPISYPKVFANLNLKNSEYFNLNIYEEIKENCVYSDNLTFYSGINVNIGPFTRIGSLGKDSTHTGSFIITGNYNLMPSGLNITLSRSEILGRGGSIAEDGNTAVYVLASGDISFNLDSYSRIGGGGGGGTTVSENSIVSYLNSLSEEFFDDKNKLINDFDNSSISAYGGIGAGYPALTGVSNINKVFVQNGSSDVGSEGYTLAINTILEKEAYSLNE
jgi:hypothetical protein